MGHFCAFIPPPKKKNPSKNQNFEKIKKSILHEYQKPKSYEIQNDTDIIFCHFGPYFALSPHSHPKKSKLWENEKNAWIYYHFTQVYQKSWSYAILLLRYGAWQMQLLFFILGYFFCPFTPLNTVYKWKTCWVKNIFATKSIHYQWKAVDPPFIENPCPIWITHPHFYKKLLAPSPVDVFKNLNFPINKGGGHTMGKPKL